MYRVAALVIGFNPDLPVLDRLLCALLSQANQVILVDNGGSSNFLTGQPLEKERIMYLPMHENQGLGAALNTGFAFAIRQGADYVATFDQDSTPPAGMLTALLQAHLACKRQGEPCAAIGPCFYDGREHEQKLHPLYREQNGKICVLNTNVIDEKLLDVDTLITSGMLVSVAAWQSGLTYNSALFVDYTDTDWCFRARSAGWSLKAHTGVHMGHALSDSPPVRILGLNLLRYSPLRRYYYFRNTCYFIRQPYVSWPWKRRLLIGLVIRAVLNPFIDKRGMASVKMMLSGVLDGIFQKKQQ